MRLRFKPSVPDKPVSFPGLIVRSFIAGVVSGAVVAAFNFAMQKVARFGAEIYAGAAQHPIRLLWVIPGAAALGVAAFLLLKLNPDVSGSGIPNAESALRGLRPLRRLRVIAGTVLGGLITFFGGLSLGSEGPSVAIGAAIGYAVADWSSMDRQTASVVATGAAGAGFAAAFHAPVAGALFALEELKKGFGSSLTASVLSAVLGGTLSYTLLGKLWDAKRFLLATDVAVLPVNLAWSLLIAAMAAGAFAALLIKVLELIHSSPFLKRVPAVVRIVAAFVAAAITGVFVADSFGSGIQTITALNSLSTTWKSVLLLIALKSLMTALGFYSKATGGLLIPSLAIGALVGEAVRAAFAFAGVGTEYTSLFTVVCMAAFLGAAFGTPMSAAVLAIELTGADAEAYLYIAAGVFVAFVTAELMKRNPLYEFMIESEMPYRLK